MDPYVMLLLANSCRIHTYKDFIQSF